jgi:hypothetical protein
MLTPMALGPTRQITVDKVLSTNTKVLQVRSDDFSH